MKKTLLVAFVALSSSVLSNAATINVGRGIGNPGVIALDSAGNVLTSGGYHISVGTFTTGADTVEPVITDFSSLLEAVALFDVFATGVSPIDGATQGTITGSFTGVGGDSPSEFNLKPIYFLVSNGPTLAESTEYGIFKVNVNFPADVTGAGATSVTISGAASIVALENAGLVIDNATGADYFQLVAIPEPSTMLLGALGALGLLRRRR